MDRETANALLFAAGLAAVAVAAGVPQVRGLRRLAGRRHVPSDERTYFRGRYRRRLLSSGVILLVAGLIAGAYLSGMEDQAAALPRPPAEADRAFVRVWIGYWLGVVCLALTLVGLALVDVWANRRFWLAQYRRMKDEHQTKLRRDLAVYKTQKPGANRIKGKLDS